MRKKYYSQSGQDEYLNKEIFKNKTKGFFLDIGANDGVTFSNTYFFEKNLDWKGISIEPLSSSFEKLALNRKSLNIHGCVADFNGEGIFYEITGYAEMLSGLKSKYDSRHLKRIENELEEHGGTLNEINVQCYILNEILENNSVKKVDYLSIDIEGGELDVLKTIDFNNIDIHAISVENNYGDLSICRLMKKNGFKKVKNLGGDEIYIKRRSGLFGKIRDFMFFNFGFPY
ncbi:FkbM family methyltransferase [Pedobacter lithocola]|uniref:FkbM family methyltransferase n=1 Tax=Pedobacter lithocola TaxID=1908239 RepID=A0ABV8P7P3_9SPHI